MRRLLKHLAYVIGYGVVGAVSALVVLYVMQLRAQPDLQPWHRVTFQHEFRAADAPRVRKLTEYVALEERVFAELREEVYRAASSRHGQRFMRYSSGSLADPRAQKPDWNRTFELPVQVPAGGALLLHGLSDSPYSLRAIGDRLHRRGYHVVGLRLPGHGTAPSGLLQPQWEDFAAAVRIGAQHLRARIGEQAPLVIVGYSNGAALAAEYALARLQGEDLPRVDALVLLSPAIGVAPAAAFAVWQGRLGLLLSDEKLGWTDIQPEYDPYKYTSFTANAGDQAHRLTRRIAQQMQALSVGQQVRGMPPILAFQSVADDTVSTPAVVNALFRRIAPGHHELILFDINRRSDILPFVRDSAARVRENLLEGNALPFDLTVLTNAAADSDELVAQRRPEQGALSTVQPTSLRWPPGVFSLSHVAVPFPPDDPIYGHERPARSRVIYLGRLDLSGERAVLALPPAQMMRLRYNPFFSYVEERLGAFLAALEGRSGAPAADAAPR
jgi:alpha-beta hydrolase superfamily lysophospholipase